MAGCGSHFYLLLVTLEIESSNLASGSIYLANQETIEHYFNDCGLRYIPFPDLNFFDEMDKIDFVSLTLV